MMIACPRCRTAYEVELTRFGARPRLVQCSACGWRWTQLPDSWFVSETATDTAFCEADDDASDSLSDANDAGIDSLSGESTAHLTSVSIEEASQRPPANPMPDVVDAMPNPVPVVTPPPNPPPPTVEEPPVASAAPSDQRRTIWQVMPSGPGFVVATSAAAVIGLLSLLVVLRGPIIELLPASTGFYGLLGLYPDPLGAGLEIRNIASARERDGDADVLTVTGEVANVVNKPASLPTIRVSLYDAHDNELQFVTLANARQTLAAGETLVFDTRITDPRPEAKRVRVGFTPSRQVTRP